MFSKCPFLSRVRFFLLREEEYSKCKTKINIACNWMTVVAITSLAVFTGVTQSAPNIWDMTLYCNDEKFSKTLTPVSKIWAILTIIMLMILTILTMSVRMIMYNKVTKDIFNIVNYLIGFLICWDITYFIQNLLRYPIPSYFTNQTLNLYYCYKNQEPEVSLATIEQMDLEARGSFPSFLMCSLCYTYVFFYIIAWVSDNTKNFTSQLITFIVPGIITLSYAWLLWKNNENHLEDILSGSIIGLLTSMYIMKDVLIKNYKIDRLGDNVPIAFTKDIELTQLNFDPNVCEEERILTEEYTITMYPEDNKIPKMEKTIIADI